MKKNKSLFTPFMFGLMALTLLGQSAQLEAYSFADFKQTINTRFPWISASNRQIFKEILSLDEETWNRGKAWALWKALIIAAEVIDGPEIEKEHCWKTIDAILKEQNL